MEKAFKLDFENDKQGSLYVNCCGCSQTEGLHSFGPASKPHYLIHYVLSGKGIFRYHDKEYNLEAGYGFLIQPNELAFYQADAKEPWSYLWVGFGGSRAGEYLESMGLSARHPIFSCDRDEELYTIVRDMMEHNTFGLANDLRRNGQMGVFLSVLADSAGVVEGEGEDKGNQYVKKAVSFIQSNYCNPIKVTDVADYVCINRSYLYTLFQSYLGMSPQQFLTTFRITKARELLDSTSYSVESIALSCGYNDALVFTRAFHAMKGMSPSQYRKQSHRESTREQLHEVEELITMNSLPAELTPEEIAELEEAEKMPITFDEDCPEMTDDMLRQFHREDKVTISISSSNMKKVKSFGPDYLRVLGHLLDLALNDTELVKKCL